MEQVEVDSTTETSWVAAESWQDPAASAVFELPILRITVFWVFFGLVLELNCNAIYT